MLLHASSVARDGDAVLLLGPPGSGKSDLVLRLIREGWGLVADDQVALRAEAGALQAAPPPALRGMLEVRGLGILRDLPVAAPARLRLAVHLADRGAIPRLPEPEHWAGAGIALPALRLDPFEASATARLSLALDVVLGRARLQAGAFA
ncbi:HPr kinase/phosphorylase [Paracraurococcus lichenis]|uniref:HPr kinase/phosphatase C-terminal domain-containing protein n=1 Tax=Paracraurococcus lichenis TaxID=3064888 RepID=A0ABT9E7S1_9PROT|nr:HPr kinase/phosphatase C-terminal domain-containing protein [Paracraurococcus sp. LOR1-02]MDO9712115.1 HPr kinase/phosphatase C-terminal domain-containing protein [Paracraurococcus sp. LOR1-02]